MIHLAFLPVLTLCTVLSASDTIDYEAFAECDEEWFQTIRQSDMYGAFISDDLDTNGISELEISKLALVAAFTSDKNLERSFRIALKYSNPFTAAVFYACLEDYMGNPSQAGYRFREFARAHPPGSGRELEAAIFAHIQDLPSFRTYVGVTEIFAETREKTVQVNMYSAFAWKLARRNQPYMRGEWLRLFGFVQNLRAKFAAVCALSGLSSQDEAEAFSQLVAELRRLYRRECYKCFVVYHPTPEAVPGPLEDHSIRLSEFADQKVMVEVLDAAGRAVCSQRMTKGDELTLPPVPEGEYKLRLWRVVDYGVFTMTRVSAPDPRPQPATGKKKSE